MIDTFGSLSVLRVISNDKKGDLFQSLPNEAVILRTGETIKLPSLSTAFCLIGKDRLPLTDNTCVVPGDIIAVPKLPESVHTNDILTAPESAKQEEEEIVAESSINLLSPLSRPVLDVPLMSSATISLAADVDKKSSNKKSTGADDKLLSALSCLAREDLSLHVENDDDSGKLLIRSMSGDHLKLICTRLKNRYNLDVELGYPPVQYRETLVKSVPKVEGRHKKQSGGSGQFGVCSITMEPLPEGTGIEFESHIKGGAISKPFILSVEKGVREQLQSGGPLAGYPVTDVKVILVDGKMHSVDSKDIAFQSAGRLAVRAALEKGRTKLLQPMETVKFVIDENLQGDVNAIVSRFNGYVTLTNPLSSDGLLLELHAVLPTSSIADISDVLRAKTAGEGEFTTEFSHYQAVSDEMTNEIIENTRPKGKLAP